MIRVNSDFSVFDDATKAIYQEANESHNVDLVRQLNNLGMKPQVPNFSGPSIVSNFMDIATKYDRILGFLKELRQTHRLLTKREFQSLTGKKWIQKSSLDRLLGTDHLMQKIRDDHLKYMKTTLKVAVVEDEDLLNVKGWEYGDTFAIHSDQVKIYAEAVEPVDRKLARDEIDELLQIISAANFLDLWPGNVVVADGVYFIDTEFKSFAGRICWEKMARFDSLIREEDKSYFREKVQAKMDEPRLPKEINGYEVLVNVLEMYGKLPLSILERDKDIICDIKRKIVNLEYVGARKAGSASSPNHFSFNLKDILNSRS